jgi:hypothetical protein
MNEAQRSSGRRPRTRRWGPFAGATVAAVVTSLLLGVPPAASFGEDRVELLSEGPGGVPGNGSSSVPVVAADAPDIIAFESRATNLVPGDTNGLSDIFVTNAGVVTRVTAEFNGAAVAASQPSISADGRLVAFTLTGQVSRIFVKDLGSNVPAQAILTATQAGAQRFPALSPEGTFIAWEEAGQVFVRNRTVPASGIALVSVGTDGEPAACCSGHPSVAGGAAAVAFESTAGLVTGDGNTIRDVYVRRNPFAPGATTTLLSRPAPGQLGNATSAWPSIRRDGTEVAFHSFATNLVPGDSNAQPDIFVAGPGGLTRMTTGSEASAMPSVSGDARYVAYLTGAAPPAGSGAGIPLQPASVPAPGPSEITFALASVGLPSGPVLAAQTGAPTPARVLVQDRVTNRILPGAIEPLPATPITEGPPSLSGNGRHVAFDALFAVPATGPVTAPPPPRAHAFRADLLFAVLAPAAHDFGEVAVGASAVRRVELRNDGFGPLVAGPPSIAGSAAFTVAANGCTGVPILTDQSCPVDITFEPGAAGAATATFRLPDNALGSPRSVALRGAGRAGGPDVTVTVPTPSAFTPVLTVNPGLGPPGSVTEVAGTGFPPGVSVVLAWTGGLGTLPTASVTAGADGAFRNVPMLVFHRDQLGVRKVTAAVAGHPDLHPEVAFLVVPNQVDAPGFVVRR